MTQDKAALAANVRNALSAVQTGTGDDVIGSGHVQNIEVDDGGAVRFQFLLRPEDPGTLVREVRAASEAVDGVTKVKIDDRLPNAPQQQSRGKPLQPCCVPAPTPDDSLVANIEHAIAVSSGKGGVGKSTVAVNLAAALAASGRRVRLLDADVYGPDIPLMFGEKRKSRVSG